MVSTECNARDNVLNKECFWNSALTFLELEKLNKAAVYDEGTFCDWGFNLFWKTVKLHIANLYVPNWKKSKQSLQTKYSRENYMAYV